METSGVAIERQKVVGTRPLRTDGNDKVTGRARYGNDVNIPGHIHGRLLRSPHAHARIVSIDASRALSLPGVRAVVTGADFPRVSGSPDRLPEGASFDAGVLSEMNLAWDEVYYAGHAVAAIAADNPRLAEDALGLIDVVYEPLPHVLTLEEALPPGSPRARANLPETVTGTDGETYSGNLSQSFAMEIGDLGNGFETADVVLERTYRAGAAHQGYIEPQACTAHWGEDGQITVWGSSQGHFAIRDYVAAILAVPSGRVKVIPSEIGGGFGAKTSSSIEPIAAMLSRKAGRPVKIALSRKEVFDSIGPTSGGDIHLRMGFQDDGTVVAADARLVFDSGAYPGAPVGAAMISMYTPYDIPNARVMGFEVLMNRPRILPYRGPGAPLGALAVESMFDEFAQRQGIDPIELRLRNIANEGSRTVMGTASPNVPWRKLWEAARDSDHYRSPLVGPNRGRGVGAGFWANYGGPASASVQVFPDGSVGLVEGCIDIGGSRVVAAQQLAEALQLPFEAVRPPTIGDTESVGYTSITGGSSTAFKMGWAIWEAAQDLLRQMAARVGLLWGASPDDVAYEAGVFALRNDGARSMTFAELAGRLKESGGTIVAAASLHPKGIAPAMAINIADVEVDPETGKVDVLRYTAVQEVGRAVHPGYVEGQMQGGSAQGIGWALNEEYVFDAGGHMTNASFLDYRLPTALDLPRIEAILSESGNPGHPFGVRGVAEVPIIPPLGTVANAVSRATGVRMTRIPMSPRVVLEELAGER